MTQQSPLPPTGTLIARPGSYYRNTRYVMLLLSLVGAIWFARDGYVNWPESNRRADSADANLKLAQASNDVDKIRQYSDEQKQFKRHSDHDIWLQKVLAFALPPIGLLFLARALYLSRGQYQLADTTLSIPGHPPIQLDDITKIDKQKWDRKGIVRLHYTTPDNHSGIITLDDFLYDRPPTDEIFKRIESYLLPTTNTSPPLERQA